ncbi:MAG: patatin-like phospholipase family protein, partial [Bacteroidota bacterium]
SMYRGQEINLLLNHYFSPAYKINDFSKFQTPFLFIGTNLFTGEQVILNKGYLQMAVRSSMSIPGYFSPTEYEGYYLVDGGVVNNYPAREVKAMGAEIIIGGDVQTGLLKTRAELASIPAVLNQILSFSRIRANEIGDSLTNLMVKFKMSYGIMDFDKYDSIIALGELVARSHLKFDNNISLSRRFVIQPGIFAGAILQDEIPPIQHWFGLGGLTPDNYISIFVPFTGLNFVQRFGFYSLVGRMKLQCNVYNNLYGNFRADVGATEPGIDELFDPGNFLAGYGVTASYDSFIGPLEFSIMGSNLNPGPMFFLNLGYWF